VRERARPIRVFLLPQCSKRGFKRNREGTRRPPRISVPLDSSRISTTATASAPPIICPRGSPALTHPGSQLSRSSKITSTFRIGFCLLRLRERTERVERSSPQCTASTATAAMAAVEAPDSCGAASRAAAPARRAT